MPKLSEQLQTVVQRTGSSTGRLTTDAERAAFSNNVQADLANVVAQINGVYQPLFSTLMSEPGLEALDLGMSGNVIPLHVTASAASATAYWDSTNVRARTVKEGFDVLLSEVSRLDNAIDAISDVTVYDDTTVRGLIANNDVDISQLALDAMGSNYSLDGDGVANLTYSLSQLLDSVGALFTGWPGTGNSYAAANPSLSFSVNLSDVSIDTTLAQAVITDLPTHLSAIRTFIGMGTVSETPTYSAHGAISVVTDSWSLERSIQALDAAITGGAGAFATAGGITSNSPGAVATDDFVFGSVTLDYGVENARMLFDKSLGAFHAGKDNVGAWDVANRAEGTAIFGVNNFGYGAQSLVSGGGNDWKHKLGACIGDSHTTDATFVGDWSSILGGQTCYINADTGTSRWSTVGGGLSNGIKASDYGSIWGGQSNLLWRSTHGVIAGGFNNRIFDSNNCGSFSAEGADFDLVTYTVAIGGYGHRANEEGDYASATGQYTHMRSYGERVHSTKDFTGAATNIGSAQLSDVLFQGQATAADIDCYLDDASKMYYIGDDRTQIVQFKIIILEGAAPAAPSSLTGHFILSYDGTGPAPAGFTGRLGAVEALGVAGGAYTPQIVTSGNRWRIRINRTAGAAALKVLAHCNIVNLDGGIGLGAVAATGGTALTIL